MFKQYRCLIVFTCLYLFGLSVYSQQVSKLTIIGQPEQCDTPFTARMIVQLDSTTLANASQINWDFNDGATYIQPISDIDDTISHKYTMSGIFSVSATVLKNMGTITLGTTIIVGSPDIPVVSLNPVVSCNGIVTFIENSIDNGISTDNTRDIYWDFGDGNDTSYNRSRGTNPSITHTYPIGTDSIYNISMRITNQCGSDSTIATVRIIDFNPAIQYLLPACKGDEVQFSNTYNPPGVNFSYIWNFGDGSPVSTEAAPAHQFMSVSTFNVGLFIQATNGDSTCRKNISLPVKVLEAPNTNFNLVYNQECDSFPVSFNNLTTGATSYHWDFGNSDTSNLFSPPPVMYFPGNYNISLTATNDSGCNITQLKTVNVNATPNAGYTVVSVCQGENATFTDTSTITFGNIDNWFWNFGDGNTSTLQNTVHTFNNSGSLNVKLRVNSGICSDSITKTFTIAPKPLVSISPKDTDICPNSQISFINTAPGAGSYNYKWYFGDGDSSTSVTVSHIYSNKQINATSYTAVMNVTNASGCSSNDTSNILVFAGSNAAFVSDATSQPTCGPDTINFRSIGTYPTGTSLTWDFGDGTSGNDTIEQHIYRNIDQYFKYYRVRLIATTPDNCIDSTDEQFVTLNPKPNPDFLIDTVRLYPPARFVFIANRESSENYTWYIEGNRYSTNNYRFPSPLGVFNNSGTYTVKYIAQNEFGCMDSSWQTIVIPQIPPPVMAFTTNPLGGCPPLTVFLRDASSGTDTTANVWDFGDGSSEQGTYTQHTYYQGGNYTITLQTRDLSDNIITKDTDIIVYRMPSANFTVFPMNPSVPDDSVYFIPQDTTNQNTYLWNFGDGDSSTIARPSHLYRNAGSYQISLTVRSNQRCINTQTLNDSVNAIAPGLINYPNAFMPAMNGSRGNIITDDERENSIFAPYTTGVDEYKLEIYNRWGERLFTSANKNIGWDGYYHDKLCKQDVYVWKVSGTYVNGKSFIKTGTVTLFHSKK